MSAAGFTLAQYRELLRQLERATKNGGRVVAQLVAVPPAPSLNEPMIDPDVTIALVASMRSGDRRVDVALARIESIEPAPSEDA